VDGDDVNVQIAFPTTPAQYFHLLRRQVGVLLLRYEIFNCVDITFKFYAVLQCFDAVGLAAGRASGLYNTEWWGAGVVICLE